MKFENTRSFAQQLDAAQTLKSFRDQFIIPVGEGKEKIYFLGNSLGLQPKRTKDHLNQVLDTWSQYGVEGFFMGAQPWMDYHDQLTGPLSTIVGALPEELVVMNTLTVNLHLMLVSFYRPTGKRRKIICEARAFPSDQYMMETHVRHYGFDPEEVIIEVKPREGEHTIHRQDIEAAIAAHKEELALVLWGGVNYYTGQVFDMQSITKAAHAAGAIAGFDLAHAAGNITLQLHDWDVDFACWCSYKYLNAGPGAIGAAYIHQRFHNDTGIPRHAGWWGYDKPTRFLMQKGFRPMQTAEGWQVSTPSALLYAAHKASLEIFAEAGWDKVQEKSRLLTSWLWFLLEAVQQNLGEKLFECITPQQSGQHGCQVSLLMLQNGRAVFDALSEAGIMTDWREPDVIRLAPVPLYNTFEEVWQFSDTFQQILQQHLAHA